MFTAKYTTSFHTFDDWAKTHRDYQTEAIDAINQNPIGQISLPTGTGKSRVQVHTHVEHMINNSLNDTFGVHVIASHRLALNHQLLNEFINIVVNAGLPFDILFVGSDRFPDDKIHAKFADKGLNKYVNEATSTTRQEDILEAYQKAVLRKRHLIVVSTYHSFNRLKVIPTIEVCTYDEAHTLVGDQFFENILKVIPNIKRNYFFTATRRVRGMDGGMNKTDVFGEVIYERSPRHMIELSEIVPPKLHIIDTVDAGDYNNHVMVVKTVISGFHKHKELIKETSSAPDALGAKLLITTTGNKEMMELHNDKEFQDHCLKNNIQVFAFSSEHGSYHNFVKNDRQAVIAKMQALPDDADAILCHIEILTEGIDLPSITGVMPFRELNTVKLLQTMGRAARLLLTDRIKLYSGQIQPKEYDKFVKPFCWLVIPRFFKSLGDSDMMKTTFKNIINTYDIPVEEYSKPDLYTAYSDVSLNRITQRDSDDSARETDLTYIIEDILQEKVDEFLLGKDVVKRLGAYFSKKAKEKDAQMQYDI